MTRARAVSICLGLGVLAVGIGVWVRQAGREVDPAAPGAGGDSLSTDRSAVLAEAAEEVPGRTGIALEHEQAASNQEAEPPGSLRVVALDPQGQRTFAVVSIEDGRGRRLAGRTMGQRGLTLERSGMDFPSRLIGVTEQEPKLVGATVVEERPTSGLVEIQLVRGCVMAGTVLDPLGQPAPAGIRVLALDPLRQSSWVQTCAEGLEPEPDGHWARTETRLDGRFELTGLLPGVAYELWAAGLGFIVNDGNPFSSTTNSCGEEEIILKAHHLYGAILRITPERAESSLREMFGQGIIANPLALQLTWLDNGRHASISSNPALVGTAVEAQAREAQARGLMVIAGLTQKALASLPIQVKAGPPFFPESSHKVDLPRVNDHLVELTVDLGEPPVLGTLHLQLLAPFGGADRLDPGLKVATLKLVSIEHQAWRLSIPLPAGALEGFTVSAVPTGTYKWELTNGSVLLPHPDERPGLVHVAESGSSLLLDLSWTGILELMVLDPDGVPVAAPLQANLNLAKAITVSKDLPVLPGGVQVATSHDSRDMAWGAPPYVLPFIPPGDWYVQCWSSMMRRLQGGHRGPVSIRTGTLTKVEIQTRQH